MQWGGRRLSAASNIVFSNGGLDPWSSGGVLTNLSDSLVAVVIPEGAHHLDLMWSHPLDPPSVKEARRVEEHFIAKWIAEAREQAQARAQGAAAAGQGRAQPPLQGALGRLRRGSTGAVAGSAAGGASGMAAVA